MKRTKITIMCECAVMLSLSIALSFIPIYEAPMGGSVTLLSMLPVLMVGVRHGLKWGVGTSFLFAMFQLFQALIKGTVFPYCIGIFMILICAAFDYILPFTALGLTGLAHKKDGSLGRIRTLVIMAVLIVFRFCCHFVTGVAIWDQWAPEGMGKYLYSLIYNGTYMLPELVLTVAAAAVLTSIPQFKRLIQR